MPTTPIALSPVKRVVELLIVKLKTWYNKTVDEQYDIQVDQTMQEVQLHQILQQLPKDVQKKLDGKMISYYD